MLFSLAVIFLVGLSAATIFQAIGLPRIIGMLATGILTGTYVLDLLDPKILGISSELRQIALIIIRAVTQFVRPEKGGQTCGHDVISACKL